MSTLDIQVEPLQGVEKGVVVRLDGALDQPTRDAFLSKLKSVISEGNTRCVLDMERVTYANSTAIGDLVIQFDQFRDAGGELVLVNPQHRVLVIIEMVGVNSVLPIFNTLEEARQHLTRPQERAAAPAPEKRPAAEAAPSAPGTFPLRSDCSTCGVTLEFAQAGRFRCPHCGAVYGVTPAAQAIPGRPRTGAPLELTVPCQPRVLEAVQRLIASLPAWSGYTDIERARLETAIAEVCTVIHQKAYEGNSDGTIQMLVLCHKDAVAIRLADHGKTLSRAAFPTAVDYMTEFEHRPRPARGNYLKMTKRSGS
ncbi:MAG TPA: anti-sigma factor antagonist [Planctomycetota bacterium]|nr:anti-sigma factor antagonist [Planctomycetota bacterium]HRR79079.1 anti-sigma factor antagonist [Planctomycetota bacterium]HRT93029.1 anti-sigma factor antagonist [Planctomycetota bacterium]